MVFVSRDALVRIPNPIFRFGQRRFAGPGRLEIFERRRFERQFRFRQRFMFSLAPDDREWLAPVALPRKKPVAQLVTNVAPAMPVFLQPVDDLGRRFSRAKVRRSAAN